MSTIGLSSNAQQSPRGGVISTFAAPARSWVSAAKDCDTKMTSEAMRTLTFNCDILFSWVMRR